MAMAGKMYKPTDADREFVYNCIMAGLKKKEIYNAMNLSAKTLDKHFRLEMLLAKAELCGKAARCISDAIDEGSVDAAKFVLSRRAGWVEKKNENDDNETPPPVEVKIYHKSAGKKPE